jgi:D-alanine-D-alanine ligase
MKPIIAFITGGTSGEAVISYKTAQTIEKHIDRALFDVITVDIRHDGWFAKQPNGERPIDKNDFSFTTAAGQKVVFNAALIGIHGTPGEDGRLQGYLDMIGLPYSSCDMASSAITFNKRLTVAMAAFAGIKVAPSEILYHDRGYDIEYLKHRFNYPVFVKPNSGGSSIGMSKVTDYKKLQEAIDKAFEQDKQVLIEEMIPGREITIGVFKHKHIIHVLPATEIIPKTEFFDFEAKYQPGMTDEITPAQIGMVATEQIKTAAKHLYEAFNLRGIVRIDFIYHEHLEMPFLLEINTVPGQTETSLVPQQLAVYGWTLQRFYTALVEEALAQKV